MEVLASPASSVIIHRYRSAVMALSEPFSKIDMILFEDGQLAGADTGKFTAELQCRKPAAEFVAKQIRLADAKGRDPKPVLSALAEVPHLRDDFLANSTKHYAADFLRHEGIGLRREGLLRNLENRPVLPKFYRRDVADSS